MSEVAQRCQFCHGTGQAPLPEKVQDVLDVLKRHPGISGVAVAQILNVANPMLVQRRLLHLEREGLAKGESHRTARLWTAIPAPETTISGVLDEKPAR